MGKILRQPERDLTDNLEAETTRNCPDAEWRLEQRRQLEQRDRQRHELEESCDPSVGIARTVARSRRLGLTVSAQVSTGNPDAAEVVLSQPLPFESSEPPEIVFTDPLPAYIDWKTFRYLNGPGRGFAYWLAECLQESADVIPVMGGERDGNHWRSFGFAPLIAERAQPTLRRQGALLRQELAMRMPPVVPRQPGHQAPLKGKPMREMNSAFAYDIHGMDTVGVAQALDLKDYFMHMKKKGKYLIDDEAGSRGGRRYVKLGRASLARLGAWPWCLTDDGKLPNGWWVRRDYAEALARWHYQQSLAAFAATFNSIMPVARHPPLPPRSEGVRELARAAYRAIYLDRTHAS